MPGLERKDELALVKRPLLRERKAAKHQKKYEPH
jgi:hypothetical protein